MDKNLLIVGAGMYAVVAFEIATDMGCFEKIGFVDDTKKSTPNGIDVVGAVKDIGELSTEYGNIVVAIGNPEVRVSLLKRIKQEFSYSIVSLLSPRAYISPSAEIMSGCIVEPMSVIHTGCVISDGGIVSAGAVINHCAHLGEGVHVDCNATVSGYSVVPSGVKVASGTVFGN